MTQRYRPVIIGNLWLFPSVFKDFLKKACYSLRYNSESALLSFFGGNGSGGTEALFDIKNCSYESAVRIADELGLKADAPNHSYPDFWNKWNPFLTIHHDGSEGAEVLRMEVLKLEIPHKIVKSDVLGVLDGRGLHQPPLWTVESMLGVIRQTAERYKEQLDGAP